MDDLLCSDSILFYQCVSAFGPAEQPDVLRVQFIVKEHI